jgi:dTDP-4-amino-4,6-dideoxygalactose transaminase
MIQSPFLPFALPDIGEEEILEVVDTLRSSWITTGPRTRRFEAAFADYLGGAAAIRGVTAVSVNSATAGLHMALEAVGVGRGDEVITTPYTFTATAEVIHYLGAHPVFVDIDAATFNLNPTKLEAAITPRTKAVIPVHFAGLACDMTAIHEIARRHNIRVVEDAAHALPTRHRGELIGSLQSDVTVFSFYATKTLTTGEGGMVVTRDPAIAERCAIMRLHGISRDAFDRYQSSTPSWYYEVIAPGFKYNLTDIASAIGIQQLKKADRFQARRQQMAERYSAALRDLPVRLPPVAPPGDLHAWHLYVLRLLPHATISRDDFIQAIADRGIGCSVHFIPLHLQPYWRDAYRLSPGDFPCALASYQAAVSLPLYTKMDDADQERVIEAVQDLLAF